MNYVGHGICTPSDHQIELMQALTAPSRMIDSPRVLRALREDKKHP